MNLQTLRTFYRRVPDDQVATRVAPLWEFWRQFHAANCMHGPNCHKRRVFGATGCTAGMRFYPETLVTGAVLPVWHTLSQLASTAAAREGIEVRRCRLTSD